MQRSTLATEGAGEASDPLLGFLAGGSEMAELIRRHDWNGSLGSVPGWPASLRTAVGLMLHSPVPLVLLWGADGIMLYNDAYGEFAGNRHPGLLGSKVLEGWPEAAELNRHVMREEGSHSLHSSVGMPSPLPIVVFVSGRGSNLAALITAQQQGDLSIDIRAVFSNNPKAPALRYARATGRGAHARPSSSLIAWTVST